jgi:hypothetical protein
MRLLKNFHSKKVVVHEDLMLTDLIYASSEVLAIAT